VINQQERIAKSRDDECKKGTNEAIFEMDGKLIHVRKSDLLLHFDNVENWIKIPNFLYRPMFTHLVLDPAAHKQNTKYLIFPILKQGVQDEIPPVLSSHGYLGRVINAKYIAWDNLSNIQKDAMLVRYPHIINKLPVKVGQIDISLLSPIHDVLKNHL
jgi:hypothetical protein